MKKLFTKFLVGLVLFASLGIVNIPEANAALAPGTYTIKDIVAHDPGQYTQHPYTVADILRYVDSGGDMPGRTGWSAYELVCKDNVWNKGTITVTSDSGRDKYYSVSEYRSEIVSRYGTEMYEAALASGKSLQYQNNSKTNDPSGVERKWHPCRDGERGGYYNNVDFKLELTFTIGKDPGPPPVPEPEPEPDTSCKVNCDTIIDSGSPPTPPPDLSCSIYTQVSDNSSKNHTPNNMTADPNGKITESNESSQFNVLKYGIPTSEHLKVNGQSEKYLASYRYRELTGTVTYNLNVVKDFLYRWTETSSPDKDGRTVTTVHYKFVRAESRVNDPYNISYWLVGHLNVYGFMNALFKNYALPDGQVTVENTQQPTASGTHDPRTEAHVFPKNCSGVYLGLENISGRPSGTPYVNFRDAANIGSRPPDVKNDYTQIEGFVSMNNSLASLNAPVPLDIPRAPQMPVAKSSLLIDPSKVNKWQTPSSITANYRSVFTLNTSNDIHSATGYSPSKINPVTVHTPVVMYARATDDKVHDQRTKVPNRSTPPNPNTDRHAFILDRPFEVTLPTNGQHLKETDAPGYGNRDYKKYVREKQVQFPFDVYTETRQGFYPKDSWITVPVDMENVTFFLPVWVPEANYTVKFRTFAINANAPSKVLEEHHANLNLGYRTPATWASNDGIMENHIAYDTIEVDVVGRLYDFRITDVMDFQWQNVFRKVKGNIEHTGNYYWVGDKMIDGNPRGNSAPFTLPVRHGSHGIGYPNLMKNVAVKTGYHFKFDMKTKGNMFGTSDAIRIKPTFYFVNKDGKGRQPVDIYYHNDSDYFVKVGSDEDKEYREVKLNEPLRNVEPKQIYDTAEYLYRHPQGQYHDLVTQMSPQMFIRNFTRKYSKQPQVVGSYGWQMLNRNTRTFIGPDKEKVPNYSMVPSVDAKSREQMWYAEYSLPADIWVVEQGKDIAGYGVKHRMNKKSSIFLQDGYVIVNFDIETIVNGDTKNPRLQYHKGPLNNQWQMEGFKYNFTDGYGKKFNLIDGDVIFYHGDKSSYDDFGTRVTH